MIQKLRRKFIATNMLLVSMVLLCVFSLQCLSTYQRTREQLDRSTSQALEWAKRTAAPNFEFTLPRLKGGLDQDAPGDKTTTGEGKHKLPLGERLNDYFPTFSMEVDSQGQVVFLQPGPGITISQETAQALIDDIWGREKERGTIPSQNLTYQCQKDEESGSTFFAFADNSSAKTAMRNQLTTSLLVSAAALLAFYLISRFLARVSVQPIERAWEQQRQFVADASHELKTPLAVILANTDIIASHPRDTVEQQGKWLGYIREEAQRMRSLVEDLLFLAKSDAAKLPTHPMTVRFDQLVTGSLLPFESLAFEQGVTLTDHIAPGVTLTGDEGQLRRLVVILLDNAVKYAGEQGAVTVELEESGGKVQLSVHNTGPAIPPEHLPHLFERFYRSDEARAREQGGYGLGLSIAQSIVESHGGQITVESTAQAGTTFTVRLPKK